MSSFSLKTQVTRLPTREFKLDGIDLGAGTPILIVRHAGESNPGYHAAQLKQANENRNASGKVSTASIREGRERAAKNFAKHVVVGWKNIVEDDPSKPDGVRPVEFDSTKCGELLAWLIDPDPVDSFAIRIAAFGALLSFATDAENFYETKAIDGAELGKP